MALNWEKALYRWFRNRDDDEAVFPTPPIKQAKAIPPAVIRHLETIEAAMLEGDAQTVGNRQLRLLKLGIEVPTKLSHVKDMLEKYRAT